MNQKIQHIVSLIQQSNKLSEEEISSIMQSLKDADKEISISAFKIERLEKVKHTTTVLLEQTIEELEAKRKSAEQQKRELEIEAALERVRSRTMAMQHSDELAETAQILFQQFRQLGEDPIQITIGIFNEQQHVMEFKITGGDGTGSKINETFHADIDEPTLINKLFRGWKENKKSIIIGLEGKELAQWVAYRNKLSGKYAYETELKTGDRRYVAAGFFSKGALSISKILAPSEETIQILERFASVFDLTYTRFLDLKNAEAQAKEAQIEAALERVRSRTMAMQKSDELHETSLVLFRQLKELGEPAEQLTIGIMNVAENFMEISATVDGKKFEKAFRHSGEEPYVMKKIVTAWKAQQKSIVIEQSTEELEAYNKFRNELTGSTKFPTRLQSGEKRFVYVALFSRGMLALSTSHPRPKESLELLERFASVFDLTYTRFSDLKQAEEQAREAQIEAALERVRSRSLAMHQTSELQDVIHTVHKELMNLNLFIDGGSFVAINEDVGPELKCWGAGGTADTSEEIVVPDFNMPFITDLIRGIKKGAGFFTEEFSAKEKKEYFSKLFDQKPWSELSADQKNETLDSPGGYTRSVCVSKHTSIFIINHAGRKFTDRENEILKRFSKVFEQSYTRFLDLKNAEAQARESQIQLALERVRARTMAMQKSDELPQAANLLFQQLQLLGMPAFAAGYCIWDDDKQGITLWMSSEGVLQPPFKAPTTSDELFIQMRKGYEEGKSLHVVEMGGEQLVAHYQYMRTLPVVGEIFDSILKAGHLLPVFQVMHQAYFSKGFLLFITYEPVPEAHDIFKRFATVFEQTYTRFLDLQNAEAQAREAQVEAALERVRARTMAMQKSEELQDATLVLFRQFQHLQQTATQVSICIFDDEVRYGEMYLTLNGEKIDRSFKTELDDEVFVLKKAKKAFIERHENFSATITGKELQDYNRWRNTFVGMKRWDESEMVLNEAWHVRASFFSKGMIGISSGSPVPDETIKLLDRFAKVFDGTYTRFNDLQKAEAQARESQIEAALERVRSRTLAMQKSEELADTSAVLFKQLINLGIEPNRLYICIIKDDKANAEFWITDEDGSKVTMAYSANLNDNFTFKEMFEGWQRQKKSLMIDMEGEELEAYFTYLNSIHVPFKGGLSQKRRLQYLSYFSKGFIGIASPDKQPNETVELLNRFAYVFNLTYTRFNDLQIAEAHAVQAEQDLIEIKAAKKRAEDALAELKSTQAQLVHAEKMASLGELTAGIAHEIQNPLNFVNNFSEVNIELIDEMQEEIRKGNAKDALEISEDIKQNLEKIFHHGNRADAIVKSMLQHSRKNTGQKEATDINALVDEFLRLSYHGLRAKDKSFNAIMEMQLDSSIERINVSPQDVGRVLLNLFNNAFYAVNEKKKLLNGKFEPVVQVITSKTVNRIEIRVKDNGTGIPEKVLDKIYQPFFTTKPTGEGTGLGLSLSYDIITKGHGGQMKVETKEGEGTEFVIQLPIS